MSVVTDYIGRLEPPERAFFDDLRTIVHRLVPDVEEAFSYGVPTYRYKGKYMLAFAANKRFMSLYPGSRMIEIKEKKLLPYKTGKGTLSFTPESPIPAALLEEIVSGCKADIDARLK